MPASPAALPPPHVLVADDDAASRRFLCDGLRSLGAQVADCADGLRALQLGRDEAFDLLLLDCRMPGAGAREVLAALRADPRACSADSLAVASSAELDGAERRGLLAWGFGDVLRKPCDIADLQRLQAIGAVRYLGAQRAQSIAQEAAAGCIVVGHQHMRWG
ncbi:MAG TPA: response regulator [Rhodanobacter sp.]